MEDFEAHFPVFLAAVSWRITGVPETEAAAVLPAWSYAVIFQAVALPDFAVCEALPVVGPYVLATGAVSRTSLRAVVSVAFHLSVTGTAAVFTVPVRRVVEAVVKAGAVRSATTVAAGDVVTLPDWWVARTCTECLPSARVAAAVVTLPLTVATGLPPTRSS